MSIYPPVRDELARLLSQPRLAEYKQASGGKLDAALRLHTWNLDASSAFFESIHYFEVALRNTMDQALDRWASPNLGSTDPWYRSQAIPLTDVARRTVRTAVGRATDGGRRPELPGRVVAELGLGFWWSLLAPGYGRTLWLPCLRQAFPAARQQRLHGAVNDVRLLRNRIAHHEPIHPRPLERDYENLLATAEQISPRLAWWIDTTSRVPQVLGRRP